MRKFLAPLVFVLVLIGCAANVVPSTPREILAASEVTFTNIIHEIGFQHEAGQISDEKIAALRPHAIAVKTALDAAHAAIITGQPATDAISAVQVALRALQLELAKQKGK